MGFVDGKRFVGSGQLAFIPDGNSIFSLDGQSSFSLSGIDRSTFRDSFLLQSLIQIRLVYTIWLAERREKTRMKREKAKYLCENVRTVGF